MGRLLQEQVDEGKALKLSRKQLRKGFSSLGTQLSDSNEGLIFEALGDTEAWRVIMGALFMCVFFLIVWK